MGFATRFKFDIRIQVSIWTIIMYMTSHQNVDAQSIFADIFNTEDEEKNFMESLRNESAKCLDSLPFKSEDPVCALRLENGSRTYRKFDNICWYLLANHLSDTGFVIIAENMELCENNNTQNQLPQKTASNYLESISSNIHRKAMNKKKKNTVKSATKKKAKPKVTTKKAAKTKAKPKVTTKKATKTTAKPKVTSKKAAKTTAKPKVTSKKAAKITAKPKDTSKKAAKTTTKPKVTSTKAAKTTAKPKITSTKAAKTTAKPKAAAKETAKTTKKAGGAITTKPATVAKKSAVTTRKPIQTMKKAAESRDAAVATVPKRNKTDHNHLCPMYCTEQYDPVCIEHYPRTKDAKLISFINHCHMDLYICTLPKKIPSKYSPMHATKCVSVESANFNIGSMTMSTFNRIGWLGKDSFRTILRRMMDL